MVLYFCFMGGIVEGAVFPRMDLVGKPTVTILQSVRDAADRAIKKASESKAVADKATTDAADADKVAANKAVGAKAATGESCGGAT